MDPTVLTVLISSVSSIVISIGVALMSSRKNKADAKKVNFEADQIRRALERGETADILQFIETFFQLLDTCYGLISICDKILTDHPGVNHGSKELIEMNRKRLIKIHADLRDYFCHD